MRNAKVNFFVFCATLLVTSCFSNRAAAAKSMNEIVGNIGDKTQFSRSDIKMILNHMFEEIEKTLIEGDIVQIRNFGNFKVIRGGEPRQVSHPVTGEKMEIPTPHKVVFQMSKALKAALNKSRKEE